MVRSSYQHTIEEEAGSLFLQLSCSHGTSAAAVSPLQMQDIVHALLADRSKQPAVTTTTIHLY